MSNADDKDLLAAEFVLGTLDAAERADVARRRGSDQALESAITAWERRLAPLADGIAPREPPAGLLAKIEARIAARQGAAGGAAQAGAEVVDLTARLNRWRRAAIAASSLAAALMLTIGVREYTRSALPTSLVAVFNADDAAPSFLLTIDPATRVVTIKPVAAKVPDGKTYQLWIKTERMEKPTSLGILADGGETARPVMPGVETLELTRATFGVSLEPKGGSPTGQPTGPVLHAKPIPAKL